MKILLVITAPVRVGVLYDPGDREETGQINRDGGSPVVSSRWVARLSAVLWSARFRLGSPA
ncbi:hypothetical protein U6V06_12605, partial [Cutibacterium acnes]